jgi:hypothetical protein
MSQAFSLARPRGQEDTVNTITTVRQLFRASIPLMATSLLAATVPAHAAGMDMPISGPSAMAATGYRYELAGPIQSSAGKSIVTVRLVHDGKPVSGAIIIQSRADMGPMGMASMTAPIKALGEKPPGTYRFEIVNGPVWNKPDNWALRFSAKVQGVAQTVSGSLTVKLAP